MTTNEEPERFYVITRLSKEDIRCLYDDIAEEKPEWFRQINRIIDSMDESDMIRLASKMADDYCNQMYWSSLRILFEGYYANDADEEHFGFPDVGMMQD